MIHDSAAHFERAMQFRGVAPCPQDARWEVPGDSGICTEVETIALVFGFVRALKPKVVVETGSNVGCVSKAICEALEANGNEGAKFITCDTDIGALRETAKRCWGDKQIMYFHETGLWVVQHFASTADLYWIDSSEEGRMEELVWIKANGKPGAVVLVHDVSLMGGLRALVETFPRHVLLPGPRGTGVITL